MTADDIITACGPYIAKLALKAALQFNESSDDWFQDICLAVVKHAHGYDASRGRPTTWVTKVAVSVIRNRLTSDRRDRRRVNSSAVALASDESEGCGVIDRKAVDPAEQAERNDLVDVVRREMSELPLMEGAAIAAGIGLFPRGAVSLRVVARAFGVNRNMVGAARQRGLQAIREKVGQAG